MHCNCSDRIVNTKYMVKKPNTKHDQKACNYSNHNRTECIRHITRRCDCHKSCQRCVQTHGNIRLSIFYPCKDHTDNCCNSRCDCCCQEYRTKLRNRSCSRAIKSIPAEPENKHSKRSKCNAVSRKCIYFQNFSARIPGKFSDTGTKNFCTDQCGNTAYHMNRTGAGKIMEAKLRKPSSSPDPVCFDRIDQRRNNTGINTIGKKFCTFCHCTGNDGRRCSTEYKVEYKA
ncbi:hypothetical protein IMSAGC020_02720 [Lachnospiraceae bacterium]|nr:hypothetical protein IMSAGC020_02720 [Lachnospiraceae bacterium]